MRKVTTTSIAILIALLAGCTTTPTQVRPPVTPNPAVRTHPVITADNYPDPTDVPLVNAYYPTGVGINVNGYGPGNANYYETGFFGNF